MIYERRKENKGALRTQNFYVVQKTIDYLSLITTLPILAFPCVSNINSL